LRRRMPTMARSLHRRAFLKRAGAATAAVMGAPLTSSARPARAAAGDRLVVAVGQWGTETPFAWRTVQAEKPLWDCIYDPLIQRDPKTFEYRPGLATEWKPSNELKTWTFKLRSGVKFHEGWGELTAEDVKFTVEQNLKPDSGGGSAPFFRNNLDRIETPDKLTVVLHFKNRVWEVASNFSQFVGYQNVVPNAACYWVILSGQTTSDREDYCPACPWAGDWSDPKNRENARKVRLAMNLAVNKKAIISALWKGKGSETPFSYYYYPFHKGYRADWKIPPYDPERAKKLLAEAGYAGGFEVRVNPMVMVYALDGPDIMEAVALDWEKVGIKPKRFPEMTSTFGPKSRNRKTNK